MFSGSTGKESNVTMTTITTSMSDSDKLKDANTSVAVLAFISAVAIIVVIVMCAVYVCKVRVRSRLLEIVNKIQFKSSCCKNVHEGCCVNSDRQVLVNPDTPTTVASDQANSVASPVDNENYSVVVHDDMSSELYTNSPATQRAITFQAPASSLTVAGTKASPLSRMQMLCYSESTLFHKSQQDSRAACSDRNAHNHDSSYLSADDDYFNHKAVMSRSIQDLREKTAPQLYTHLHEFSNKSVNIYHG